MEPIISLEQLLDSLCRDSGLTICIHDISGILQKKYMKLPHKYQMHASSFCDAAKSTPKGYRVCMRCKMWTNEKASHRDTLFQGYCCYGIYKIVCPVLINDKVTCIIYLGNLTDDAEKLRSRLQKMCIHTGVNADVLASFIDDMESVQDPQIYFTLANLIAQHIRYLDSLKTESATGQIHWAVAAIKQYADESYTQDLLLKDVAKLYYVNPQYIGKLFKEQTGCTFRQYVNTLRIEKAKNDLLAYPNRTVMEIALDCGFPTVTYFNRIFREHTTATPQEFRIKKPPFL